MTVGDSCSVEYQRFTWDALRKGINSIVNKVSATNIKDIIPELFTENLIRGRGIYVRSCIKSQMASPAFTQVFASLIAIVNTKFLEIGNLLLRRLVLQLNRSYKLSGKPRFLASVKFIANLVNQQVAHEILALQLLILMLENRTQDSHFRDILHKGEIDKRVQFMIEGLFAIRKAKFQGCPAVNPKIDLAEPEDQFTHEISLNDKINPEFDLDIFKIYSDFPETEKRYEEFKRSIIGVGVEEECSDSDSDSDEEESSLDESEEQMKINDETEMDLINLRRTIYLTNHVNHQLGRGWSQFTENKIGERSSDGAVHHAIGMLQPGEDLPTLLRPIGAALVHDQQSISGQFREMLCPAIFYHPQA
ncbi:hypothetical protein ACFE04_021894 [Oxalis oulophora]